MWYRNEVLRTYTYVQNKSSQYVPDLIASWERNKIWCACANNILHRTTQHDTANYTTQQTTPHHTTQQTTPHHTTQHNKLHHTTQHNTTNYTAPHNTTNYTTQHHTTQTIDYVTHTNPIEIQILTFISIRHGHRTHHMTSSIPTWSLSVSSADLWASFPSLTRSSRLENWDWLTIEIEWHK